MHFFRMFFSSESLKLAKTVPTLLVFSLLLITASLFAGETTSDDSKALRDSVAVAQKYDPDLAKKIGELANRVSTKEKQVVSATPAQHPAPNITEQTLPQSISTETKDFWVLEPPKEWPAQVMPGVRGGSRKPLSYIDNLVPLAGTKEGLLFADVKVVSGTNNTNEENIGLGLRSLVSDENLILGGNFFYDTKYTQNKVRHNQLAFGLEGLSKWVDLRSNFYFPTSGKKLIGDDINYSFRSQSLVSIDTASYEEPLRGLDYEGGVLIPYLSDYLETRAFIGGYHYFPKENKTLNGIEGRIEIRPIKAFTINLEVKKDNYDPTEYIVEGFVSVPLETLNVFEIKNIFTDFGKYFSYKKGIRPLRDRMVDRIVRDVDVTLKPTSTAAESKVHDLIYVDNSNTGAQDGSLQHPYAVIQEGVDNAFGDKWVYVKQGLSQNAANYYAGDITLTDLPGPLGKRLQRWF